MRFSVAPFRRSIEQHPCLDLFVKLLPCLLNSLLRVGCLVVEGRWLPGSKPVVGLGETF